MENIDKAYNEFNLSRFERKIGYIFHNRNLLVTALTRKSYTNENEVPWNNNEALEFLGDCVLQLIISQQLFEKNSDVKDLTNLRQNQVKNIHIAGLIKLLKIDDHLLLGKGERAAMAALGVEFWANLYESILAAIYLDSKSLEPAKLFLERLGGLPL